MSEPPRILALAGSARRGSYNKLLVRIAVRGAEAAGVACTLIDQSDGTIDQPKLTLINVRSMEFCRRWGIAEKVKGAVWSSTHPLDFVYAASMVGPE